MAAEEIRALVVPRAGGPEVLEVQSRPMPVPGPGEILVEVAASGVNFKDVYEREGTYPRDMPFVLGDECAGYVRAVGDGLSEFAPGDLVATADSRGAHGGALVMKAARAVRVPDGVAPDIAAAAMLQGMTAHYLVNSNYPAREGECALVHAAAGGVGQLLVQMLTTKGVHVIATVGTEAKAEKARGLGAQTVIRYDEVDDLADAVRDASGGGVHVVYDGVGKSTFDASMDSLRRRGMLALFGGASGQVPPVDPQRLNRGGSLFLTRPTLAHYIATREELTWRAGEVLGALADGTLHIEIGGRYRLDEAADAYRDLEGRRSTGKLLLLP